MNREDCRYTNILLFDALEGALRLLLAQDADLFGWQKAKTSIAHCLATHLEAQLRVAMGGSADRSSPLPGNMKVDLFAKVGPVCADILVHDRAETRPLAVMFANDYLGKTQADKLRRLAESRCSLVLGIAFLPQKDYILIYRPDRERMEYFHFSRQEGTSSLFMQKEEEPSADSMQLSLGIKAGKRRRRKATATDR